MEGPTTRARRPVLGTQGHVLLALLLGTAFTQRLLADDIANGAKAPSPSHSIRRGQTLLEGLNHPRGVAVQPGTGHVFISESGAGRVIRLRGGKREDAVIGFSREPDATLPGLEIGPLGLCFVTSHILIIGGGGEASGRDEIYVVRVPSPGKPPASIDDAITRITSPNHNAGNFYGVTKSNHRIYAVTNDGAQAWIAEIPYKASGLDEATGYGTLNKLATLGSVEDPVQMLAITWSPTNNVVVGHSSSLPAERASAVSFYRAYDGQRLLRLPTPMIDIVALAYATRSIAKENEKERQESVLYAVDFARGQPGQGGIYRLDAGLSLGRQVIVPHMIANCNHPTALAFNDEDGALFVTELGESPSPDSGSLIRYAPGL